MSEMSIYQILEHLPHRYPFLLIDRVTAFEPGVRLKAIKNVSVNEPFFQGHFPHHPVFPGVLILEAMAQATGVLAFRTRGIVPDKDTLYLFVGVDNARFKRQVGPGDQIEITVEIKREARGLWKFAAEAKVADEIACTADLAGAVKEISE